MNMFESLPHDSAEPRRNGPWRAPKMVWWYWALIDEMIAHPEKTKKQFAVQFNVSPACIGLITNSDLFKAHFDERVRENAESVDRQIRQKLTTVALAGLDNMAERLEKKRDGIALEDVNDLTQKTLEKLGYGVKPAASPVTVNSNGNTQVVVPVSLADLESAREALRRNELSKVSAPQLEYSHDHLRPYSERPQLESQPARTSDSDEDRWLDPHGALSAL